jgi:DNA (cytosine-5)-methyltransferase 1
MSRIVGEVRPKFVFAENSPHLRTLGLGTVVSELAGMGYDSRWGVLGARHVGAPHKQRNRIWIASSNADGFGIWQQSGRRCWEGWAEEAELALSIADADCQRELQQEGDLEEERRWTGNRAVAYASELRLREKRPSNGGERKARRSTTWWAAEPGVVLVVHGLPHRVDRIRALGNAQIPAVAALAWEILSGGFEK